MMVRQAVAERVRQLMIENNLFQKELEEKSNISHRVMNKLLTAQNSRLTMATIYKIAIAFAIF